MPPKDPVAAQAYNREYKRANRWRYRPRAKVYDAAIHANRRALGFGVSGTLRPEDVADALSIGRCHYCGTPDNLEVDHVIPMDKGGPNTRANIVASCSPCNRSKHQTPTPWRWSRAHDACLGCGTTERKHSARGFCNACYIDRFGAKDRWRPAAQRTGVPTTGH